MKKFFACIIVVIFVLWVWWAFPPIASGKDKIPSDKVRIAQLEARITKLQGEVDFFAQAIEYLAESQVSNDEKFEILHQRTLDLREWIEELGGGLRGPAPIVAPEVVYHPHCPQNCVTPEVVQLLQLPRSF